MSEKTTSTETYIPFSRGIDPYLGSYTTASIVIYLQLALRADYRAGPDHGTIEISLSANKDLEDRERISTLGVLPNIKGKLGLDPKTVNRCLIELSEGHVIGLLTKNRMPAPPFIEILETKGTRRGKIFRVRLLKAKLSAKQFKPIPRAHVRERVKGQAVLEEPRNYKEEVAKGIEDLVDMVSGALESPEARKKKVRV